MKMLNHRFSMKMDFLLYMFVYDFVNDFNENVDPHTWHNYGFFPVYMWLLKEEYSENADLHSWYEYGSSPLCILVYFFKLQFSENADRHTSQENGFSVIYVLMFFKVELWICLCTYITRKCFLSCVYSHVFF